jgi:hypothetical protein
MLVENVHVYEMMKIRVLNGGHSAISCRACSSPTLPPNAVFLPSMPPVRRE